MSQAIAIRAVGMVSGLGRGAEANAGAMRLGYDCFQTTDYCVPASRTPLVGAPFDPDCEARGPSRLAGMLAPAMAEAMAGGQPSALPVVLLCLADDAGTAPDRIERLNAALNATFSGPAAVHLGPQRHYLSRGPSGFADALIQARRLLVERHCQAVLLGAVDSLLTAPCIARYGGNGVGDGFRLLTAGTADGFIPGEAAAALLLTLPDAEAAPQLLCTGIGFGQEPAPVESGEVTRADGLVAAIEQATAEAGIGAHETDFRITAITGEQWFFTEDALALQRTFQRPKPAHDLWHPAEHVGHVGAAVGAVMVANAFWATRKGYAPGPKILFTLSGDGPRRGAFVLDYRSEVC